MCVCKLACKSFLNDFWSQKLQMLSKKITLKKEKYFEVAVPIYVYKILSDGSYKCKAITVKPLNRGYLRVFKKLSVIERCPRLGGNLKKIVTLGT